ncbi:hypothetical protein M0R45_015792 [Rubus argutus]|uniref:Uncharacterized protein n=1 Tax=Rubus argutus TaxID=59490 RepID=A0AAW1XR56_RUBAR
MGTGSRGREQRSGSYGLGCDGLKNSSGAGWAVRRSRRRFNGEQRREFKIRNDGCRVFGRSQQLAVMVEERVTARQLWWWCEERVKGCGEKI